MHRSCCRHERLFPFRPSRHLRAQEERDWARQAYNKDQFHEHMMQYSEEQQQQVAHVVTFVKDMHQTEALVPFDVVESALTTLLHACSPGFGKQQHRLSWGDAMESWESSQTWPYVCVYRSENEEEWHMCLAPEIFFYIHKVLLSQTYYGSNREDVNRLRHAFQRRMDAYCCRVAGAQPEAQGSDAHARELLEMEERERAERRRKEAAAASRPAKRKEKQGETREEQAARMELKRQKDLRQLAFEEKRLKKERQKKAKEQAMRRRRGACREAEADPGVQLFLSKFNLSED